MTLTILYSVYIVLLFGLFFYLKQSVLKPYSDTDQDVQKITEQLSKLHGIQDTTDRITAFNNWVDKNSDSKYMKEFFQPSWNNFYSKYNNLRKNGVAFVPDIYDFFLEESLLHKFGKRKLAEAVPGFFLALGIIGTFVGIAIGVSVLDPNGNADEMKDGIGGLLGGMQVKFASSIAGILLSLLWQFLDKSNYFPKLIQNFYETRQALDLAFPTQEQNTVLAQMLSNQEKQSQEFQVFVKDQMIPNLMAGMAEVFKESLKPQMEQSALMERSITETLKMQALEYKASMHSQLEATKTLERNLLETLDKQHVEQKSYFQDLIVPSVVSGISESIEKTLTPQLEHTQKLVQDMLESVSKNQLEGINAMVDTFVASLTEITGDHMKELGNALTATVDWQQKVHQEMSALVQSMQDSAKEQSMMVEKTTALTGQINLYTEKITDYHVVMEDAILHLNSTTDKNITLQSVISDLLHKMTEERSIFQETFESNIKHLKENLNSFTGQTEQQLLLNTKLESNIEQIGILSGSQKILTETLSSQAALSKETTEEMDKLISKINEAGTNQLSLQEVLNSALNTVVNERVHIGGMVTDINKNLVSQLSEMDKRIERLRQVWENTSKVFTTVNKKLETSMHQFTDDMHKGLEHTFSQFDEELSKSVGYLSKAVSAIHEGVIELPSSIDTLKISVTELNKHAKTLVKSV